MDIVRPKVDVNGSTQAFLGGEYQIEAGTVAVEADSTNTASSNAINLEASGFAGFDMPTTTIATDHTTEAFVAVDARTTVSGGLALAADSITRAEAGELAVTIANVDVELAETTVQAGGTTRAYIGEGAQVGARTLSVAAISDTEATADALLVGTANVEVQLADVSASTVHTTEAYAGSNPDLDDDQDEDGDPSGRIAVLEGGLSITATSTSDARVDDVDIGAVAVAVEVVRPTATVGGLTRAFLAGEFVLIASEVLVGADSTNTATSDALNLELTSVSVDVPTTATSTIHTTQAFVEDGSSLLVVGGRLALDAHSRNRAVAGAIDVTISGVDVAESDATMKAMGATRAYIGEGVSLTAPNLSVAATSDNLAASDTVVVDPTFATLDIVKATAQTDHTTEVYIGPDAGEAPTDGLSGQIVVSGAITLDATSTSDAVVGEFDVDVGALVVEVLRPHAEVKGSTRAFVGGDYVVNADGVVATATATNAALSDALSLDFVAVAVDIPQALTTTTHTTEAYVAGAADFTVSGGALVLNAVSDNTAEAGRTDINLGSIDVAVVVPHATAGGETRVAVEEGAQVVADGLTGTANAASVANVRTDLVIVSGFNVEVVRPKAETQHVTEAFVGPRTPEAATGVAGSIDVGGGTVSMTATSDNTAQVNQFSITGANIDFDSVRPEVTVGGRTTAHLGGTFDIAAGATSFTASALDNRAASNVFSLDVAGAAIGGTSAPVKVAHDTESYLAADADATVAGGPLAFIGRSTGHATADTLDISIGGLNLAKISAEASLEGATRSYIDSGARLAADDVSLVAESTGNTVDAAAADVQVGLANGIVLNPTATAAHGVEAFVGGGADVTAADVSIAAILDSEADAEVDTVGLSPSFQITSVNPTATGWGRRSGVRGRGCRVRGPDPPRRCHAPRYDRHQRAQRRHHRQRCGGGCRPPRSRAIPRPGSEARRASPRPAM